MVIPRSARTHVGGQRDGALIVRVTAAPVDGAANDAVIRALAAALGMARADIRIEAGLRDRRKVASLPLAGGAALATLGGNGPGGPGV